MKEIKLEVVRRTGTLRLRQITITNKNKINMVCLRLCRRIFILCLVHAIFYVGGSSSSSCSTSFCFDQGSDFVVTSDVNRNAVGVAGVTLRRSRLGLAKRQKLEFKPQRNRNQRNAISDFVGTL